LSSLPPQIAALLADERNAKMPSGMRARLDARLSESLNVELSSGEEVIKQETVEAKTHPHAEGVQMPQLQTLAQKPLLLASISASLGVLLGASGMWFLTSSPLPAPAMIAIDANSLDANKKSYAPKVPTAKKAILEATAPLEKQAPEKQAPEKQRSRKQKVAQRKNKKAPVKTKIVYDTLLAQERALIEFAQNAFLRKDAQNALNSLRKHRKTFPSGRLLEEREALMIQVLLLANAKEAALRKAKRFKQRFPKSLFLPIVNKVLNL